MGARQSAASSNCLLGSWLSATTTPSQSGQTASDRPRQSPSQLSHVRTRVLTRVSGISGYHVQTVHSARYSVYGRPHAHSRRTRAVSGHVQALRSMQRRLAASRIQQVGCPSKADKRATTAMSMLQRSTAAAQQARTAAPLRRRTDHSHHAPCRPALCCWCMKNFTGSTTPACSATPTCSSSMATMAGRSRRSQHREHVHSCHSPTRASFLTGQVALSSFRGGACASIDGGVAALCDCRELLSAITTYGS